MRPTASILVLLAALAAASSAQRRPLPVPHPVETVPQIAHWRAEVIAKVPVKLSGCAVGDVDPEQPGAEVVSVGGDGSVFVTGRAEVGWQTKTVFQAPGELIQVAIGDLMPERPGNEIVAVGKLEGAERGPGPGAAYVVFREEDAWKGEIVLESPALVHGVCVRAGEAIVTGYDKKLHRLCRRHGKVEATVLCELPGAGKNCLWAGDAIVVSCSDGSLVELLGSDGPAELRPIDRREKGRGRLGTDGRRLVVSDDDGTLSLYRDGQRVTLLSGSGLRQRGAVIADLDPSCPGDEIATAGYDRMIRIFRPKGDSYETLMPYVDPERFHHLAAGQLDDDPAIEVVAASFAGNLVLVEAVLSVH